MRDLKLFLLTNRLVGSGANSVATMVVLSVETTSQEEHCRPLPCNFLRKINFTAAAIGYLV